MFPEWFKPMRIRRELTIALVEAPELKMPVALVGVVRLIRVRDLCEPWPGIFG